ncbi:hypothetical protein OSB04_004726 [Centaurea solstitialis]|uniref:Uncharacterized protein n=1 Tax=Centaurea solstitialis TaxID=347529 RepID=A0AA38WRP0_9ASTR|nr:hypothetical protein OSB04_004726 [Centaurea solstitialis]
MGSSSKPSSDDCDQDSQHDSISFLSILESYPLSYIVDEKILDETYSFANIVDKDDQEVIPSVLHLELACASESHDQEFIPRVVHLELIEGAIGSHEDCKDIVPCFVQEKAIGSDEESKVYDGYEGDKDDIDSIEDDDDFDDDDDDDLKIRIEEFIAKNIRKWKEEMINDKLLCLEY